MKNNLLLVLIVFLFSIHINAQNGESYYVYKNNDTIPQLDCIYYLQKIFNIQPNQDSLKNKKVHFSVFPTDSNNSTGRLLVTSLTLLFC